MTYVYCSGGVPVVADDVIGVKVGPVGEALTEAEKEGFLCEGKIVGQVCENHRAAGGCPVCCGTSQS